MGMYIYIYTTKQNSNSPKTQRNTTKHKKTQRNTTKHKETHSEAPTLQ